MSERYIHIRKNLINELMFHSCSSDLGCQRVMGASANFAKQYATKRYRSNCINWGMVPFLVENPEVFELGDYIFIPGVRDAVLENKESFSAFVVKPDGTVKEFPVSTGMLTGPERQIIADGCLINYYRNSQE